ncbi:hypothetical protein V6N12_035819 [Hibiscus sabdariffa]|uniref:RNase H type-1 domain-containing protein n=1 Tax=Hibiscus sabdariffa TaxID=183260 RepID=A0ABR2EP71_9ROSI
MSEAIIVLHGLQFAIGLGLRHVILERDSKTANTKLNSVIDDLSEIRKALADSSDACRFRFVPQDGNLVAHAMAHEGRDKGEDLFWVHNALLWITDRQFTESP